MSAPASDFEDDGDEAPPEPELHRMARLGDVDGMATLLAAGEDVNQRAELEYDNGAFLRSLTPLMVAARSIDGATVDTLRWLLAHGADVTARSEGGITAAWYAAGDGGRWPFHDRATTPDHVRRLELLLDAGLDVNERASNGRSLLCEACRAGDPARVALLLARGAVLDTPGGAAHEVPVFCAADSGSAECVRLILAAGSDPNMRGEAGATPLTQAGSREVVDVLVRAGADLHAVDRHGYDVLKNVLHYESNIGGDPHRLEVARALLDAGLDVHKPEPNGHSRLYSAAFGRRSHVVEFLLAVGAKVDAGDDPLHGVCWQGGYESAEDAEATTRIIELLVAAGADVNAPSAGLSTPLHQATDGDGTSASAVRALLALGAFVDPLDSYGRTPLMYAAIDGDLEAVRALLAAGADPTIVDQWQQRTAVDHATQKHEYVQARVAKDPSDAGGLEEATESLRLVTEAAARRRAG